MRILHETIKTQNKTAIFCTHDAHLTLEYASRVLLLHHGALIFDGTPDAAFGNPERLEQVSLVPPLTMQLQRATMIYLHPHTKIVLLAIVSCLVILLDSPIALFVCFLVSLCLQASIPPSWRQIRLLILFIGLGTWGLIYSQAIFYNQLPRTVIFTLIDKDVSVIGAMTGGVHLYREGLFHGAVQSLRFNTMLTVSCFIIWTTPPRDLLLALVKLRVPYSLAFMVTTGLRYIPLIASEAKTVIRSQRLRGFRYLRLNFPAYRQRYLKQFAANLD